MQQWEEMYYLKQEAREAGLSEGRAEGRAEGQLMLLKKQIHNGMISISDAAKCLDISVDDFQAMLDKD